MNISSKWLGRLIYQKGLELQQDFVEKTKQTGMCYLLGLEHFPVITLGLKADQTDILAPSDLIERKGVQVVWTKRGGRATCHAPGQLVIYPIVPLKTFHLSVRGYMTLLESSTRVLLQDLGVECVKKQEGQTSAIYTSKGKIVFFGVHIQRGIAFHGLAINVSNDLDLFSLIRSCGVDFEKLDRLSNYQNLTTSILFKKWVESFCQHLQIKSLA